MKIRLNQILGAVCAELGLEREALRGERRYAAVVKGRHYYCWLASKMTTDTLVRIGHTIGDRDHTTVMNSIRRGDDMMVKSGPDRLRMARVLQKIEARIAP
jgi:chromosomal replication initiator protein